MYAKKGIGFRQAKAVAIRPEGDADDARGAVDIVHTSAERAGQVERIRYDYLINATGPQLKFAMTPGLGPDGGHTVSVCTADHAVHAAAELAATIERLKAGERQTLVVGMGHGTCTCEGAAFEYVFNVDHELREAGVRDLARLVYLTNEAQLGDFGVDGMTFDDHGFETTSQLWTSSLYRERGVEAVLGAHVHRVEPGVVHYETLDGAMHELEFDFAMLLPPFGGVAMQAFDRDGADITSTVFAPSGFMKVDADYTPKPYEQWRGADWPKTYQAIGHPNVFAVGIAFAPPHQISRPRTSPNGTAHRPLPTTHRDAVRGDGQDRRTDHRGPDQARRRPPRPRGLDGHHGRRVRRLRRSRHAPRLGRGDDDDARRARLRHLPHRARPGRHQGEIGLSGHWAKLMMHYLFLYKAKGRPGWQLIPE